MITLTVNIDDLKNSVAKKLQDGLDGALVNDAIRAAVEAQVRDHLLKLKTRSPKTNFYGRAAATVNSRADDQAAVINIQQVGIRLRHQGGIVTPGKSISSKTGQPTKAIALPTSYVPIRGQLRALPHDIPNLAYVPTSKGGDTIAVLVEGEQRKATRGKRKGQYITVPKKDGKVLYVLRKKTTHEKDDTVLPTQAELLATASSAIEDLIEALNS